MQTIDRGEAMPLPIHCPQSDCPAPAEIVDRWTWGSTDGAAPHVRTRCTAGHVFTPPADQVTPLPAPSERELQPVG